jgi:type VI protein secretion system component VasA
LVDEGQPWEASHHRHGQLWRPEKNNHVLRLAAYLIEMKFFLEVEFVFYVRGHMKNACNRMFNQMSIRFHKQDIFTQKQALDTLGNQDNDTMIDATEGMFKNYGVLLEPFV